MNLPFSRVDISPLFFECHFDIFDKKREERGRDGK
jgi:hypothetical protein